jgi:hypothetical protein
MGYIKEIVWCIGTRENQVTREEAINCLISKNIVIEIPLSKYKNALSQDQDVLETN